MNSHAILRFLQNYAVLIMIAVLMMALGFMSDSFFTLRNLINILNQNAPLAIMASAIFCNRATTSGCCVATLVVSPISSSRL